MVSDVYFPRISGVSTSIRTFRRELAAQGVTVGLVCADYEAREADIWWVPAQAVPLDLNKGI